ncbi:protein-S-isoprenylcysteine O-methyltransferase [Manduca sexta]|uniref:protein-S-isoprenylcysteine O-methyltransferase n=1 Tax=Manduca sexta TaxID=7130 RepID=UPI00188E6A55|nr:protein-S-isoprenylcysteine O-methyltransferase [Manduca sexta]
MEAYNDVVERAYATGVQATMCFMLSVFIFTISLLSGNWLKYSSEIGTITYWGPALYLCLLNFGLRYWYKGFAYKVAVRAAFLGTAFAAGVFLATFDNGCKVFGLYIMILTTFHFSEFMSVALTNPLTLSLDSFILNHSVQYGVAAVASWVEWAVEFYFFPEMKTCFWLSTIGVLMCIGGEILRKSAMFTAKTNFNHTVQFVKKPGHELVTHGVYSFCRHPSYVGWFYWSLGTQITLLNPVCLIIYALASWTFFRERVYAEELTLLSFFGPQYVNYQKKVGTGLPFIHGYVPENTRQRMKDDHWSY